MFTKDDHAQLELARDLMRRAGVIIASVLDAHRLDMTMQVMVPLTDAKRDMDSADREVSEADRYVQWLGKNQDKHTTGALANALEIEPGDG